jgi:hypothetical protein
MDYNEVEKSIYTFYQKEIIEKFKKASLDGRTITKAIDLIKKQLVETKKSSIIFINIEKLHNCIYKINHREDDYSTDLALNSIISNEIKESFGLVINELKTLDDEKLIISFDDFVKELISYDCLIRLDKRVTLNIELYRIFYENKNYDGFTLEYFENHVVNSKLYRKVYTNFYPGKPIPIAEKKIDQYNNISYDIIYPETNTFIEKKSTKNNLVNPENEILEKLDLFKDEEKYLILHTFYNLLKQYEKELKLESKSELKIIDLAQFLRMIRICQGIKDISLFEKEYSRKQYKIASNGLEYFENSNKKRDLKKITIAKLKDMQVPLLISQIESL